MYLEIMNKKHNKIHTCLKVKDITYIREDPSFEVNTYGYTEQTNIGHNVGWYQSDYNTRITDVYGYLGSKVKFWYNDSTGHHEEKEFDVQSEGDIRHLIQMVRIGLAMETV